MSKACLVVSKGASTLAPLAAFLMLGACASNSYMGIPLNEGAAGDPVLRLLAQRAAAGDKRAQLDLGIRYEEGRGVELNKAKAKRLYRLAGSDSGGTLWVYTPSVGNGAPGRVMSLDRGPRRAGLEEAQSRLENLND